MPKKYFDKLIFVMLAAALLSAVVLASMLSVGENSRIMRSSVFSRVSLVGTYRIDGGGWRLLAGNYDKTMQAVTHKTVEFRGHFNKDIAENLLLMLRIQYMEVKIDINGEEVFSFGAKDRLHRLSKSEGDVWQWFVSPGIKTTDDVHIILRDVYGNKFLPKEKHFFENIYFGHGDALYRKIFGSGGLPTLLALFITLLGVAELFTALLFCLFHQKGIRKIAFIAAFTISLGVWCAIQRDMIFLTPYPPLTAYMEMFSMYMTAVFFVLYVSTYVYDVNRTFLYSCAAALLAAIFALSVLQILGYVEAYSFLNSGVTVSFAAVVLGIVCLAAESASSSERILLMMFWSTTPIAFGALADLAVYWLMPGDHAKWLQRSFYLFAIAQWGLLLWQYKRGMEIAAQAEHLQNEITKSRVAITLAQIQPHFIYNALATIKALCAENPETAEEAVAHFAKYLRGNMDSLSPRTA